MNTPMQELLIFVSEPEKYPEEPIFEHKYMVAALKKKINELLEKEKQMVIDAYDCGDEGISYENGSQMTFSDGESYYNEKFKNDKS